MTELPPIPVRIRSFRPSDAEVCRRLYLEGPVRGTIPDNDTGLDIDDIEAAYMRRPENHFWVAENEAGEVVGMIGVQQHQSGEGEIRRLRVRTDHRGRGIGSALLERAVRFCRENHHLKVILDTNMSAEPAVRVFERHHFRLSRSREIGDKIVLHFYLDLYSGQTHRRPR